MIAITQDNNQYTIVEQRPDSIVGYSQGGGFHLEIKNSCIKQIVNEAQLKSKKIPVWASTDANEIAYPGLADPAERWNGWAKPCFERGILHLIMDNCYPFYDETETQMVFHEGDVEEGVMVEKTSEGLYCVDGFIWDICNEKGQYIHRNGTLDAPCESLLEKIQNYKDLSIHDQNKKN